MLWAERFEVKPAALRIMSFCEAQQHLFGVQSLGRHLQSTKDLALYEQQILQFAGCIPVLPLSTTNTTGNRRHRRTSPTIVCYFPKYLPPPPPLPPCDDDDAFQSRRVGSNLSPIQLHTLSILEKSEDFIVCPTDKNLGPCILESEQYIQQIFSLLNDKDTYLRLSKFDAGCFQTQLQGKLQAWFEKYIWIINSEDWKYLERTSDSSNKSLDQLCPHFYIMPKIHKSPWKPCPIVSYAGSFLYGLGKWLEKKLLPICRKLPTYCSSSFDLIADLKTYESDFNPETDRLFTADANSMYTNIDTTHAINQLRIFFKTSDYCTTIQQEADCIIDALELLMKYNIIKLDDTYWLQLQGTAMGAPPAPAYATIYYAIHELTFLALYFIQFNSTKDTLTT
jgi:hypothetical protein